MRNIYHVLNGDALAERFPISINGERIIFRECLVDGPVRADSYEEFLQTRSNYLDSIYPNHAPDSYENHVTPQLEKINSIPNSAKVYLWFERDVFCQVNAWFVCYQLFNRTVKTELFWILPTSNLQWGFGGMDEAALISAYENPLSISDTDLISLTELWRAFSHKDTKKLREISELLGHLDFILPSVSAVIDEIESQKSKEILREIINKTDDPTFGKVFREFHTKAAIYGYGDLLVKRMYDEIINT